MCGKAFCFCPEGNQGFEVSQREVESVISNNIDFSQSITRLKKVGLLGVGVVFASSKNLGEFLIFQQEKIKTNPKLFSKEQETILGNALREVLGRGLYS